MGSEIASQRITQCHATAKPDQDSVQSRTQVYRKIANASPYPSHVKTGHAEGDGGQHVDTSIPAVKDWKAVTDLRNQLNRPGEHDDRSRSDMHDHGDIAHGKAGNVTVREVPLVVVPTQRGKSVERCYRECED